MKQKGFVVGILIFLVSVVIGFFATFFFPWSSLLVVYVGFFLAGFSAIYSIKPTMLKTSVYTGLIIGISSSIILILLIILGGYLISVFTSSSPSDAPQVFLMTGFADNTTNLFDLSDYWYTFFLVGIYLCVGVLCCMFGCIITYMRKFHR